MILVFADLVTLSYDVRFYVAYIESKNVDVLMPNSKVM